MTTTIALAFVGLPSALCLGLALGWMLGDSRAPERVTGELADMRAALVEQASLRVAMEESRDLWRARALAAERWLPTEIVVDILTDEVAS